MCTHTLFYVLLLLQIKIIYLEDNIPIIVSTWSFVDANTKAWEVLKDGGSSLDAVEQGGKLCERQQCDGTVGYGGSPDENGETTLDAMIMNGKTMNVGAVGSLRRVKNAISVARHVLEHSQHSLLVGELATQFAVEMGFHEESLTTPHSKEIWKQWRNAESCQPNFWMNVTPDPRKYCGPYKPQAVTVDTNNYETRQIGARNHDTIGLVAIDEHGDIAAGTSTNGAKYKMPGRVGDSPLPGAGAYADNEVGGAAATGDGDIMLRFLPSFLAVEEMRRGASPVDAASTAVSRIASHYPQFMGAVIAVAADGRHGAACHGITMFPYVVHTRNMTKSQVRVIQC